MLFRIKISKKPAPNKPEWQLTKVFAPKVTLRHFYYKIGTGSVAQDLSNDIKKYLLFYENY